MLGYDDITPRVGRGVRSVRQRQDVAQGERRQVSRSGHQPQHVLGVQPNRAHGRQLVAADGAAAGDAHVDRRQRELRPGLRSPQPGAQDLRAAAATSAGRSATSTSASRSSRTPTIPAILEGWGVRTERLADRRVGAAGARAPCVGRGRLLPPLAHALQRPERHGQRQPADHAANYDSFSVTAPSDPRLPGGGGYAVRGLYDITPTLFGQVNNLTTWGSNFGEEYSRYNGVLDQRQRADAQRASRSRAGSTPGRPSPTCATCARACRSWSA